VLREWGRERERRWTTGDGGSTQWRERDETFGQRGAFI